MRSLNIFPLALALVACDQGEITVRLTDAPADNLDVVLLDIQGVDIQAEDGSFDRFDFDSPRRIDIASLRNGTTENLITNASIDAGRFQAVRLRFDTDNTANQTLVTRNDGTTAGLDYIVDQRTVDIDFEIEELGSETITLDVNLRASILQDDDDIAANVFRFDPLIRATRASDAARIQGSISAAIVNQNGCAPGVYLYQGSDAELTTLASDTPPLESRFITNPLISGASYQFRALPSGDYTVAVTCDALADDPESEQADVTFLDQTNVTLASDETATVDFQ